MKKLIISFCMALFVSNLLGANTGLFLVFADKFEFNDPVNFNTSALDADMEFNIDLGEGFWGLKLDPAKIGYDGVDNTPIKKLFRVYDANNRKLSPFSSKWLNAENGMRFYYLPNLRYEKELFFVVNKKTLEVNYSATFGFGGIFQDWGQSVMDPIYNTCPNDPQYIHEQNKEEGIYTVRVMSKTGTSRVSNAARDCYWGARHDENDLYHYFPGQRNVELKVLNRQFGVKMNSNELIPIRMAFNFHRLRLSVFAENNRYYLNGNTEDQFSIQGDKMVLYKEFTSGLHNITVETPDFDMPACNPTIFELNETCLVKLWFYADKNPNKMNLHMEYPAVRPEDKYPNALFMPVAKAKYTIKSYVISANGADYLTNANGEVALGALIDANVASSLNKKSHMMFLTKHDKPGLGMAKHGLDFCAIYFSERYNELAGVAKLWGHADEQVSLSEQAFSYSAKTYESFMNKVFMVNRVKTDSGEEVYTIKNKAGLALTNDGTALPKLLTYVETDQRQWWVIDNISENTPSDVINPQVMPYMVYVNQRTLHVSKLKGGETIELFMADGKSMMKTVAGCDLFTMELPAGGYIVKVDAFTSKFIIK